LSDIDVGRVLSGAAQGWDTAIAMAAVEMSLPLEMALPFEGVGSNWPQESRDLLDFLCDKADRVVVCCEGGYQSARDAWKYGERDRYMVDSCNLLLALFDQDGEDPKRPSGTAQAVSYAQGKGVRVRNVWPEWVAFRPGRNSRSRPL
jgi:uncharacterized phage-like protein YoqJ